MSMSASLFTLIGHEQEISTGNRFDISDADHIWFVKEGHVDIFISVHNELHHLIRLSQGDCYVGIKDAKENPWRLNARICSNTTVLKVAKQRISNITQDQKAIISEAIDHFIFNMTRLNRMPPFSKNIIDAAKLNIVNLKPQDQIYSSFGVKWLYIDKGEANYCGDTGIGLTTFQHYLPLTPYSWAEFTASTKTQLFTTLQLINEDKLWDNLSQYVKMMITFHLINIDNAQLFNNIILYDKIENNKLFMEESLDILKQGFSLDSKSIISPRDRSDELSSIIKRIFIYMGVDFKNAPPLNNAIKSYAHFQDIMSYSKVFFRKVYLADDWYKHNQGPLLAFKRESMEPVALIPKNATSYWMHEYRAKEAKKLTANDAKELATYGFMFYRHFEPKPIGFKDLLKFGFTRTLSDMFTLAFFALLAALLALLNPIITQFIFDDVVTSNDKGQLLQILYILLAIVIPISAFELTKRYALLNLETKFDNQIQSGFWDRILKLPVSFFRKYTAGELISRIGNLMEIRSTISGTTLLFILDAIFSGTNMILLFYYQPWLALIMLSILAVVVIIYVFVIRVMISNESMIILQSAKIFGTLSEIFTAFTKIRVSGAEYRAFYNWVTDFSALQKVILKVQQLSKYISSFLNALPLLIFGIMYVFIAFFLNISSTLSIGSFLAFNIAFGQVLGVMFSMLDEVNKLMKIIPLLKQTKIFLDVPPEVSKQAKEPGELRGEIEFSKISFKYENSETYVLKDISFNINIGEYVAIVGESGSGKSTLIRLLLGFEQPSEGRIYFDSKDSAHLDKELLRKQIGVVLQNDQLIPGNIYSNIAGMSDLSVEQVWEIAQRAAIARDILMMPMKMNTIINMEGVGLSGGQKQRILIARALARDPKILILDEATRSLDNITQKHVIDTVSQLKISRIVVAHRLNTLVNVDKIIVLDKGMVVEQGSFAMLMQNKGHFYRLAQQQM